METMTIPPASADMKRGVFGPAPARRNLLWDATQARRQAQRGHDVAARSKGEGFVAVTGDMNLAQFVHAVGVWKGARNRAACRAGHVLVGKYRAAREAEQEIPAPTCGGLIYGPPTPWSAEGRVMRVRRPVDVRHHTAQQAIDAILAGL